MHDPPPPNYLTAAGERVKWNYKAAFWIINIIKYIQRLSINITIGSICFAVTCR